MGGGRRRGPSRRAVARAAALVALALPAVLPLFAVDWFESHEAASYPARIVEVRRAWEGGMPSARWFPDLDGGRGYPFLSFYAPLSFWTAAAFHVLGGLSVAGGLKAALVLAAVGATAGAYRLARLGLGPAGAFAAAALWAYAPYVLRDLWTRGDVAEFFALGAFPWALFGTLRLARRPGIRAAVGAGALGALAILSHNVVALFTGLAMAGTAAGAVLSAEAGTRRRVALAAVGAGTAALALSAFFWGPALGEKRWVQLENLRTGYFAIERHWVGPADLVELSRPERIHRPGQPEPMTFGLGAGLALAPLAVLAWRGGGTRRRRVVGLGAGLLVLGVLGATRAAQPLYDAIPILRFVGLPWRFLGPASLGLALLAGAGLDAVVGRARPFVRAAVAAAVALVAIVTVADLRGPIAPLELRPWMLDPAAYREAGFTATVADEYRPVWAQVREPIPFRGGVATTGPAQVLGVERGVARWRLRVAADAPVDLILQDSFFPGWVATVGGESAEPRPRPGSGHVQIAVPAGEHEIVARLEPTPRRRAWRLVSWAGLVLALGALALPRRAR